MSLQSDSIMTSEDDTSLDGSIKELPLSLEDLCFVHLVCNIEHFPLESLTLLPTTLRCRLLLNLPVVDVCRLEKSAVASGIDLNSDIWLHLCRTRLPQEVVSLLLKDYSRSSHVQWQNEFFGSLVSMILNRFHPCFPFRQFSAFLLKFAQDVLFGVPDYMGIENWQPLGIQHPFLATVKDTTLLYVQELFRPWLVPPRHGWIVDPQRQCHSSSQLLHIIMKECGHKPERLFISCDQFSKSELMVTHCFGSLLQKFLSNVESLVLMASFRDEYIEPAYTVAFDDDENTCGVIPRFMLEIFLSQDEPRLKSLKLEGSVEFLTHTLWSLSPLLAEPSSTDSHSVESIYKDTMSNVPYSGLQSIAIEVHDHDSDAEYTSSALSYLSAIIAHQAYVANHLSP